MRRFLFFVLFLFSLCSSQAQKKSAPFILRLFEDNDYINVLGHGTDHAYTHGLRADVFHSDTARPLLLTDRWMTKNNSDVLTRGWGIMQTMITPTDLQKITEVSGDYRYACSLTLIRTFHVSNPVKKYSIQSEYFLGVLGPAAFGKETQTGIHRILQCGIPKGWHTQLRTAVLGNINITYEKALMNFQQTVEWIGGVKTFTGTSMNALSLYTLLRVGKMNPYFNGLLSNYHAGRNEWQLYGIVRPSMDYIIQNAHVQGGLFMHDTTTIGKNEEPGARSERTLKHFGLSLDYGIVITRHHFSITFTQRSLSAMIREQGRHEVGNLSLYIPL